MSPARIILGIALFAIATAILYVWGMKKSMTQAADLEHILMNKSAINVVKYLKKHDSISQKEMLPLLQGVKAGVFWSKKRAVIQNPKTFVPKLICFMTEQQLIEEVGKQHYRLKK